MFRHVVVPVDGSEAAERVIDWIAPFRAAEGRLHLVRVVPGRGEGPTPTPFEEARLVEATSYLEYVRQERGASFEVSIRRGNAAAEILQLARTVGAHLIALSAHGESGMSRLMFGSVAGEIVKAAECPVLVAPSAKDAPLGSAGPERVLVALDGAPESEAVLRPAMDVARDRGATLVLLHVVEPMWAADDSAAAKVQAKKVREAYERLGRVATEAAATGLRALPLIVRGDPAIEILAQVDRRRAGLLCLSATGRGSAGRLFFGSVVEKVIPKTRVPLLLIRRKPAGA
jgi:nucleotide-binding universal stress UspA family protein